MPEKDLCSVIAETYYDAIYKYCFAALGCSEQAAKDCTQETFFIMVRKRRRLDLSGNMRVWLYKTADRVIRNYLRRERRQQSAVPLDELEIPVESEFFSSEPSLFREYLTAEESALLTAYYGAGHGSRAALAESRGLTLRMLYKRVEQIKSKLKAALQTNNRMK